MDLLRLDFIGNSPDKSVLASSIIVLLLGARMGLWWLDFLPAWQAYERQAFASEVFVLQASILPGPPQRLPPALLFQPALPQGQ